MAYQDSIDKIQPTTAPMGKTSEELDKALDQFYENGLKERDEALQDINKAVGKMINATRKEAGCQTE